MCHQDRAPSHRTWSVSTPRWPSNSKLQQWVTGRAPKPQNHHKESANMRKWQWIEVDWVTTNPRSRDPWLRNRHREWASLHRWPWIRVNCWGKGRDLWHLSRRSELAGLHRWHWKVHKEAIHPEAPKHRLARMIPRTSRVSIRMSARSQPPNRATAHRPHLYSVQSQAQSAVATKWSPLLNRLSEAKPHKILFYTRSQLTKTLPAV